ncbi:class I SAM-dependent methyltransferase [Oxalobacteraceae bacterium OM1]|nr:class I SAM-dependent methyltransferase [Oxalobacteraceae bacterium OM1]
MGLRSAMMNPWMQVMRRVVHDPIGSYGYFADRVIRFNRRNKPPHEYPVDHDWRSLLGVSEDDRIRTERLWPEILGTLESRGIRPGPASYLFWNDADPALVQAIWCLARRLRAAKVVETGVAHGVTSRFILEALGERDGHLWSIDLPPRWAPEVHDEIGAAVADRSNWSLILGPSRRCLRRLLNDIGQIDLFIHDSEHTTRNMLFEMSVAWKSLRPGGAMVVDDIDLNEAFDVFCKRVRCKALIAKAEPIRPDPGKRRQGGLFGVALKH